MHLRVRVRGPAGCWSLLVKPSSAASPTGWRNRSRRRRGTPRGLQPDRKRPCLRRHARTSASVHIDRQEHLRPPRGLTDSLTRPPGTSAGPGHVGDDLEPGGQREQHERAAGQPDQQPDVGCGAVSAGVQEAGCGEAVGEQLERPVREQGAQRVVAGVGDREADQRDVQGRDRRRGRRRASWPSPGSCRRGPWRRRSAPSTRPLVARIAAASPARPVGRGNASPRSTSGSSARRELLRDGRRRRRSGERDQHPCRVAPNRGGLAFTAGLPGVDGDAAAHAAGVRAVDAVAGRPGVGRELLARDDERPARAAGATIATSSPRLAVSPVSCGSAPAVAAVCSASRRACPTAARAAARKRRSTVAPVQLVTSRA